MSMEFATFHVALRSDEAVHPNQTLQHLEYLSMIDMMLRSARLFHPAMTGTVLTDAQTVLTGISASVRRVEYAINPQRLMYDRTMAQLNHLLASNFAMPLVLLDSDILINASLAELVRRPFDVALTWRTNVEMPINGGFLLLNNQRPGAVRAFFKRFASIYQRNYADRADWFGDQLALRDAVGLSHEQMVEHDIVEVEGCRVLLLPCDTYNYAPDNLLSDIMEPIEGKAVLHFKGQRKRLMAWYWNAHLADRSSRWPTSRVRAWLARRQLAWLSEMESRSRKTGVRA